MPLSLDSPKMPSRESLLLIFHAAAPHMQRAMSPNKFIKFAPVGRPTNKVQCTLLAAYERR
jgi:hypothetical protein